MFITQIDNLILITSTWASDYIHYRERISMKLSDFVDIHKC